MTLLRTPPRGRVLVVDDDLANAQLLQRILARMEDLAVSVVTDARDVGPMMESAPFDLVLLDLHMPHLDGFAVLEQLQDRLRTEYLPVLVLTADTTRETKQRALSLGAKDFLTKPVDAIEVMLRAANLLETRALHLRLREENERLEARVRDRTRALEQALGAAMAASRAKTRFLASVSHELRTPLNAVIGFSDLLRKNKAGSLREQDLHYLDRIAGSGRHLLGLVDRVLELTGVDSDATEPDLTPASIGVLIQETLAELQPYARPGVELRQEVPEPVAPFRTDVAAFKQMLHQLVENALKFTAVGSVTVAVTAEVGTRRPARLEVIDTGIGIDPERLEAIFHAFEQADNSERRRHGGLGVGLAIARVLCGRLGYTLSAESAPGRGSRFRVDLNGSLATGRRTAADCRGPAAPDSTR